MRPDSINSNLYYSLCHNNIVDHFVNPCAYLDMERALHVVKFVIILMRKRKLVALPLLSYKCIDTINALWLFLTVPLFGLQYVIVVFPDHTHLCNIIMLLAIFDLRLFGYEPWHEISNNVAF